MTRPEVLKPQHRRFILVVIFLAGALARLIQFLDRRSLWHDEVLISLNIASRTWSGLVAPLDYDQAAPVLWLWAQRAIVTLAGVNEYSLRVLSLVAGVALVILSWQLSRRLVSELPALVATALVALSPMLIRYSNEAKPYELDAAVAVGLQLLAFRVAEQPSVPRRWLDLLIGSVIALLVSIPAIMVLAGVGLFLLLQPSVRASGHGRLRTIVLGVLWVSGFSVLYLAFYRVAATGSYMKEFWEYAFLRPGTGELTARTWHALYDVVSGTLVGALDAGRWGPAVLLGARLQVGVAVVLVTAGLLAFLRRRDLATVGLLAVPALLVLLASMMGAYPISVRLVLFLLPAMLILMSRGMVALAAWAPTRSRTLLQLAVAAAFLMPALGRAVLTSLAPIRRQDVRPVIQELDRLDAGKNPVYIYSVALPAWTFYTTRWNDPDTSRLARMAEMLRGSGVAFPDRPSRGRPVVAEGDEWHGVHEGRRELYGVPTGRPVRWGPPLGRASPDSGWAENEARRIREAGPSVWLLFMPNHVGDRQPNLAQLEAALAALGGRVTYSFQRREAELYRYAFE